MVRRRGGPRRGLPGDCDAELTALGGQLQLASNTPGSHRLASFQVYDLREVPWGTGWAEGGGSPPYSGRAWSTSGPCGA